MNYWIGETVRYDGAMDQLRGARLRVTAVSARTGIVTGELLAPVGGLPTGTEVSAMGFELLADRERAA